MILILDNYDSFTFNLNHYVEQLTNEPIVVKRNDELNVDEVDYYSSVIISPGPGLPSEAGITNDLIKRFGTEKPILGVCLGHQAIGEVYGAKLMNLDHVLHGVQREIKVAEPDDRLFIGLPEKFTTGHYHSWVISDDDFPDDLLVTARDENSHIMAISHKRFPVSGVQFHPESIMTMQGLVILKNWFHYCYTRHNNSISL